MNRETYPLAVRVLCEFAAKSGDLDLRFTPSPTAQEGIAGHRVVAGLRAASDSYRAEVPVCGRYEHLLVRGRADGFDATTRTVVEVKTYRGALDRMPDNHRRLHWAQARVYAWLLCAEYDLPAITVSLVYFDVDRQRLEPPLCEHREAAGLRAHFETLCRRFVDWADRELVHRASRDDALNAMRFPYPSFRAGQRELAEAVYKTAKRGACLLAQAPTGIGKTIATLFPMLKAMPSERIDKVYFLTAKGTGRKLALEALRALRSAVPPVDPAGSIEGTDVADVADAAHSIPTPLRILELSAREKACEYPGHACHGDSCRLAKGFYDRLPAARAAAVGAGLLERDALRAIALAHDVCPYYLGQALVPWCDVIVGDYNHWFDTHAALHAAVESGGWRVGVLVDEAHNLVDRARSMYSAALRSSDLDALRVTAPSSLKKPLDRLRRAWHRVHRDQVGHYAVRDRCPPAFATALQEAVAAMTAVLADEPSTVDGVLLRFCFDALHFGGLVESFGSHSLFDVTIDDVASRARHPPSTLCIRNVVPAPFLAPRFATSHTTTLFSATLTPRRFYGDTLGLPGGLLTIDVDAPFHAGQLTVHVARSISTRYRDREASLAPIVDLIARQYRARPGNYLAFLSSYDYLERVVDVFGRAHRDVPVWLQTRRMNDDQRDAFLARFEFDGCGIGFAVLGGAFAEGVDLVGSRLVGAFIATLGLPQVNVVNEALRKRMDVLFGSGYDYTYLYPGLRRVTQAAGRVIRTLSDTGSVHLIDDRFARAEVARLLPAWWRIVPASTSGGREAAGRDSR